MNWKECKVIKIGEFIYILSNEEIKEGDWLYTNHRFPTHNKRILQADKYINYNEKDTPFRKIIATTNSELKIGDWIHNDTMISLPRLSEDFIESYCEKPVDKVLVKYEPKMVVEKASGRVYHDVPYREVLIVNPDNTINIKSIKESWNREKVIEFVKWYSGMERERVERQLDRYEQGFR